MRVKKTVQCYLTNEAKQMLDEIVENRKKLYGSKERQSLILESIIKKEYKKEFNIKRYSSKNIRKNDDYSDIDSPFV